MSKLDEVCEVIITAPNADWLADFTRRLVEDHLSACGHEVTEIRSIYRWADKIHDVSEARVALHTRTSHLDAIIERTRQEHPYEVPCVIAVPITDGLPAYVQWILDTTDRKSEPS